MDRAPGEVPLATQQFWEDFYQRELNNFAENGDTGEVWFGEHREERILAWIQDHEQVIPKTSRVVDVGCGNASLLIKMSKCNFKHLTGLDYSTNSLDLARRIADREGCEIHFEHCDILQLPTHLKGRFDLVLDKGTFDVINMRADSEECVSEYIKNVLHLFRADEGRSRFFLITSCNCTEEELRSLFSQDFDFFGRLQFYTYTFGNQSGSAAASLIFMPH